MRIYVGDAGVFEPGNREHYGELRRMLLRVAQGQHTLVITDVDAFIESDFFEQAAAPMDREEWRELVERTAFAADLEDRDAEPGQVPARPFAELSAGHVDKQPSEDNRVSPDTRVAVLRPAEVGAWAEQPLWLWLENENDRDLLECMARAFAAVQVEDAYLHGWLKPDGRGGAGEILVALRGRHRLDRIFVFADSDRASPGAPPATTSAAIAEECSRDPYVPFHLTQRREKENYIPLLIINTLARSGPWRKDRKLRHSLRGWLALPEEQRHHDDVRARFGSALTDAALGEMRRCDAALLRAAGEPEMRALLNRITEYL